MEQNSLGPQPSEVLPDCEPVALYVRVSSADQNCQLQLRELGDYAVSVKPTHLFTRAMQC